MEQKPLTDEEIRKAHEFLSKSKIFLQINKPLLKRIYNEAHTKSIQQPTPEEKEDREPKTGTNTSSL